MAKSRNRSKSWLVGFLISVGALLLITAPITEQVAFVAPQGKGGEVVAKPTPTKPRPTGKAPSRSTDRVFSLEGTVWTSKADGQELSYEFLSDGRIKVNRDFRGTWKQNGTRIVITFDDIDNDPDVMTGTIFGDRMNGSGRYKDGDGKPITYRWSAKRKR